MRNSENISDIVHGTVLELGNSENIGDIVLGTVR